MNANHSVDVIAPAAAKRRATGRPALVEHLRRLRENGALFLSLAREAGIDIGDSACAPMIPCIVGSSIKALQLSDALLRRGINVDPILFPLCRKTKRVCDSSSPAATHPNRSGSWSRCWPRSWSC